MSINIMLVMQYGILILMLWYTVSDRVRGLKDRRSLALRAWSGRTGDSAHVLDCLCPGMVVTVCE